MLKGPRAQAAGIVYLQNEEHLFKAKESGRIWSVYGSPVSPCSVSHAYCNSECEPVPLVVAGIL